MSTTYETIALRRTIRRFQQTPIPEETIQRLIDVARLAPSGANLQPCEFVVVDDPELLKKIFVHLRWAAYIAPDGNPPEGETPVCYVVVLINTEHKKQGGEVDAAAAIMNILIAAQAEGVGSCWLGSIDREGIRMSLHIPDNCLVNAVVALGYPNEQPVVEEMKESVKYWKTEDGVLHIPKRKLEDVYHKNSYRRS